MPDLMTALRNADAAGDNEAANRIAAMIKSSQQQQTITQAQMDMVQQSEDRIKELDEETDLHYYGQRYYLQDIGRFNRQDPVAFILHNEKILKQEVNKDLLQLLSNPQRLNTYSYSVNNPIIFIDPDGQLRVHFSDDMTDKQKQQFNDALNSLTENVKKTDVQ